MNTLHNIDARIFEKFNWLIYRLAETKEKAQSFLTGRYILVGVRGSNPLQTHEKFF